MSEFRIANGEIVRAAAAHPSLRLLSGLTAAGAIASALLTLFGSAEYAIFGVAFVIAFLFVLLTYLSGAASQSKSRRILADVLAWCFGLMMVVGIAALGVSFFNCRLPFGVACHVPPKVAIDTAGRLSERDLEVRGRAMFLKDVNLKKNDEVEFTPGEEARFPLYVVLSGLSKGWNGDYDAELKLLVGANKDQMQLVHTRGFKTPDDWRLVEALGEFPDGPNAAFSKLRELSRSIRADAFPVFLSVGCIPTEETARGSMVWQVIVHDRVGQTYAETPITTIKFIPSSDVQAGACPDTASSTEAKKG